MKTVGMLGGTDWRLTALYCQEINRLVQQRLGGGHSAKMVISNPDAAELVALQEKGQWREVGHLLEEAGSHLANAGADFLMVCGHAFHVVAEQLNAAVPVPFLHMGEAIGQRLRRDGVHRVGMLGATFDLEQTFLRQSLADGFGIDLVLPDAGPSFAIHDLISRGETVLTPEAGSRFEAIFAGFRSREVEAVLLGDRRIAGLARQTACPLPVYDPVSLHVEAAVRLALAGENFECPSSLTHAR